VAPEADAQQFALQSSTLVGRSTGNPSTNSWRRRPRLRLRLRSHKKRDWKRTAGVPNAPPLSEGGGPAEPRSIRYDADEINCQFALVLMGGKGVLFYEQPGAQSTSRNAFCRSVLQGLVCEQEDRGGRARRHGENDHLCRPLDRIFATPSLRASSYTRIATMSRARQTISICGRASPCSQQRGATGQI
jgi:hypothetical protein